MKIYNQFPAYQDFIKNEIDTLTYLRTRGLLIYYSDLESQLNDKESECISKLKKGNLVGLDLHTSFIMEVEGSLHTVLIGANVVQDYREFSYFLALLDSDDDKKIIRKFHFDYADIINETKQKVPSFHLQYGGKMSPKMQESELDDEKIDHWLSLPRLNFHPINLALLLDLILCEFRTEETIRIIETSEWRDLIFKNEKFLKKPYYESINEHLQSAKYNKQKLLRDFCYGD